MNAIVTEAERLFAARLVADLPSIIELEDMPRWIGLSRASIFRLRARNRFPIAPISQTTRRIQFAGVDVLRYLLRSKN
jgi:predicted DNA-binding transcriptional regulator AlpA